MALSGELIEGKVLFAARDGFFGEIHADGLSSGNGRDDAEATGISEGVEKALRAQGLDFGAIVALIKEESVAVAGGEIEPELNAVFGNGGGEGKGGIAGAQNWGDAVRVFAGKEPAEDALRLPVGAISPSDEFAGQVGESCIGLVRNHDVITEAFDPALSAGGEAVGSGALLLKSIAQGRINPLSSGRRGKMSGGNRSHRVQCDAGTVMRQTRKQVAARKPWRASGRYLAL